MLFRSKAASTMGPALESKPVDIFRSSSDGHCPDSTLSAPGMTKLWIDCMYSKNMDSVDITSLNEFLNRIQAMMISNDQPTVYDLIGLKPDDMEIYASPITHPISTTEEPTGGSPS